MIIKSKIKLLLIGPFSPPITGESLANDTVLKNLQSESDFSVNFINNSFPSFKENLGSFSISKVWFYLKKYLQLYKVFRAHKVYITLGQTFFGVLKYAPFILTAKLLRKQIIIHIHGNYLRTEFLRIKGFKRKIVKAIVSKADKGIVLSKLLLPNLIPFIDDNKIFILSNFVEDFLIKDFLIEQKKIDQLRIVFLSNLMTEKGILYLLDALEDMSNKNINFSAKIAGNIDDSIRDTVLSKINKNKSVKYLGVVRGNSKKMLLTWANVFVFPTFYLTEGQPISLLEAMATGNIILTTKHAGIPDVFTTKNGFYIKKRSKDDIVDKLEYVNNSLQNLLPMIRYNHIYASTIFTEEKFINTLKSILYK